MTAAIEIAQEEFDIAQDTMQGMFLTFDLADEGYGLEIRYVTEIIGIQKVKILLNVEALIKDDDWEEYITEMEVA